MKNKKIRCTLFFLLLIILVSCNKDQESSKQQSKVEEKEVITVDEPKEVITETNKLPYNPNDFKRSLGAIEIAMLQKDGEFSGDKYSYSNLTNEIDSFSKDLTATEYYEELLKLLKEDYTGQIKKIINYDVNVDSGNDIPDEKNSTQENLIKDIKYVIMIDSSGSMAGEINGETKMEIAKKSVTQFANNLPEGSQVSLRVYGHEGTNQEKDKMKSCAAVTEIYKNIYNATEFSKSLNEVQPVGWTPIAKALESLKDDDKESQLVVYVVSDGIETCGGDPVQSVQNLKNMGFDITVNILGFNIENKEQMALQAISDAGNGEFQNFTSQEDLNKYLRKQNEKLRYEWSVWKDEGIEASLNISDSKKIEISDIETNIKELASIEYEHLKVAIAYMKSKSLINNEQYETISNDINKRYSQITNYAQQTSEETRNEIILNTSENLKKYKELREEKIKESFAN
ncbi:VWA domain-containing protein [Priestia flexa]|uniref:VWA domain-containing protein n=1 Tax=Priestia flexa TaxID=86664 RepID=UPI00077CB381|nr:VWA domain-containing protein [Priestia flexa]MED4590877.1 VWA domain-containing protein [Priestia flexa]